MWRGLRITIYAITGIALGGMAFEVATLPSVSALRDQNPATTSMIDTRNRESRDSGAPAKRVQICMPLEKISLQLQRAVLPGEDTNFPTHHGFTYEAIQRPYDHTHNHPDPVANQNN